MGQPPKKAGTAKKKKDDAPPPAPSEFDSLTIAQLREASAAMTKEVSRLQGERSQAQVDRVR